MNRQAANCRVLNNLVIRGLIAAIFASMLTSSLASKASAQSQPQGTQTIWQFWQNYTGGDKIERLLNSYAVGLISGCTGTMISPHIMLSAAHCGGPGFTGKRVQFFHMDED